LIQDCLADPSVVGTVKSHLTEFQLTLIAGASRTLPERMELARPVLRPLIDELCAFRPLLETPTDFMVLLGLPALDQACVQGADAARSALDEARARRNNLTHVLSTLYICLNRTLGDSGAGDHGLALLWSDYVADVVPVLLLTIRSLHALWNAEHWQALPWQSAQAQAGLFGLLDMSAAERQAVAGITGQPDDSNADAAGSPLATEIRAMHHTLATLREHAYKCLGRLARSPDAFSAARVPDVAANFTGCLFADVQHMAARHWRVLLGDVAGPILAALGNWPGQDLDIADSVRTVGNFAGAWLEPLFAFCSQRLDAEWHDLRARGITAPPAGDAPANNGPMSVTDDMVHEKVVRDWTRAWAQQILSRLLASIGMWLPEAVQIEHELASSARVPAMPATAAATQPQLGNRALGAYILATPSALAATLSTCLSALKHSDTTAATRVLAQLSALAPSLLLVSLMPMYHPPTPAHASTVASYRTRMQRAPDLLPWLAGDLPAALVALLRDAGLTDLQDAALALLADLAYVSAAIQTRMPVQWPFRSSSGDADQRAAAGAAIPVGDPGLIYRQSLLGVLQAAGAATDEIDQALVQIAISPAAESKRRRALLKIALQPLLALETSQLFSDPHAPRTPAPGRVGKHTAPAEWTNKLGGHSASVLDNDSQFDLGALMP
ncbi:karyopherin, partial [Coemansia spiralis]